MTIYKLTDFNGNQMPISNGNLLINGGFKINPRGQSSYSTNSTSIVRTVAMWRIQAGTGNSSITVTVNSDGTLTLTNNTSAMGYFVQAFHEPFEEGDYTASMNLLSKTGSISFAINDAMDAAQEVNNGFNAFTGNGSPSRVTFYLGSGSSMKIQYCKLEHGNIATAYFEEDEATALIRSQQYVYNVLNGESTYGFVADGYIVNSSYVRVFVDVPVQMKGTPTLTTSGTFEITNGDNGFSSEIGFFSINNLFCSTNKISINIGGATGLPSTGYVVLRCKNNANGSFVLSCEP